MPTHSKSLHFKRYFINIIIFVVLAACYYVFDKMIALEKDDGGHDEAYYQKIWCRKHDGDAEVTLADKTRVDCVTKTHAIEVDFAPKWKEAVGQSLHYAYLTGKKAGILIIVKKDHEKQYVKSLEKIINAYNLPIDVFVF